MPAETSHPCFTSPENIDVKVWRYMDFTKYVELLESCCLFFVRSDHLDDPYEGATSHVNVRLRPQVSSELGIPSDKLEQMAQLTKWVRQWTYLNCWHMNEYESAAMWKLYAKTNEAVAIQSTFRYLEQSLPSHVYLGIVHYIDYDTEWMPEGNTFWPFVHKRKSFEHEREVRAVIQDLPQNEQKIEVGKENKQIGQKVQVELDEMIHRVYVSPTSPQWFADLVDAITKRYGHTFEVTQSDLAQEPVY
jgi:hypothetical protein